jgi:hypothetical protein
LRPSIARSGLTRPQSIDKTVSYHINQSSSTSSSYWSLPAGVSSSHVSSQVSKVSERTSTIQEVAFIKAHPPSCLQRSTTQVHTLLTLAQAVTQSLQDPFATAKSDTDPEGSTVLGDTDAGEIESEEDFSLPGSDEMTNPTPKSGGGKLKIGTTVACSPTAAVERMIVRHGRLTMSEKGNPLRHERVVRRLAVGKKAPSDRHLNLSRPSTGEADGQDRRPTMHRELSGMRGLLTPSLPATK